MDGENILSWNFANWITVLIMVGAGFALFGFLGRIIHAQKGGNGDKSIAAATTA